MADDRQANSGELKWRTSQDRLSDLLARNSDGNLTGDEAKELDLLIARSDQLTIQTTRARYTLQQQAKASGR